MSCCEAVPEDLPPAHHKSSQFSESRTPKVQRDGPIWQRDHFPHARQWADIPLSSANRRMPTATQTKMMTGPWGHVEQSAWDAQMSKKSCAGCPSDVSDIAFQVIDELTNGGVNPRKQQSRKLYAVMDGVSLDGASRVTDHTIPVPSQMSHNVEKMPMRASKSWKLDRNQMMDDTARSAAAQQSSMNSRTARWVRETNSQARYLGGNAEATSRNKYVKPTPNIVQQYQSSSTKAKTGCNKALKVLQLSGLLKRFSCGGTIQPSSIGECLYEKKQPERCRQNRKHHELAPILIPQPQMHCGDVATLDHNSRAPRCNFQGPMLTDMWSTSDATDWTAFDNGDDGSMSSNSSARHNGMDYHFWETKGNPLSVRTKMTDHDSADDVNNGGASSPSSSISLFRPRLVFDVTAMEQLRAAEAQNDRNFSSMEPRKTRSPMDARMQAPLQSKSRHHNGLEIEASKSCRGGSARRWGLPEWLPKLNGAWIRTKPETDDAESMRMYRQEGSLHQKIATFRDLLQVKVSETSFHYQVRASGSPGAECEVPLSGETNAKLVSDGRGGGMVIRSHLKMSSSGVIITSEWGHRPSVRREESFQLSDDGNSLIWRTCITKDGQTSCRMKRAYLKA